MPRQESGRLELRRSEKLTLRLPAALHARLVKAAAKNLRSLNAEIIHRLEQHLEKGRPPSDD